MPTRELTVTLDADLADTVERRVHAGAFGSVDELVGEAVRSMIATDTEIDDWLRSEVVAGHAEYMSDPSAAVTADALLPRIKARRAAR